MDISPLWGVASVLIIVVIYLAKELGAHQARQKQMKLDADIREDIANAANEIEQSVSISNASELADRLRKSVNSRLPVRDANRTE